MRRYAEPCGAMRSRAEPCGAKCAEPYSARPSEAAPGRAMPSHAGPCRAMPSLAEPCGALRGICRDACGDICGGSQSRAMRGHEPSRSFAIDRDLLAVIRSARSVSSDSSDGTLRRGAIRRVSLAFFSDFRSFAFSECFSSFRFPGSGRGVVTPQLFFFQFLSACPSRHFRFLVVFPSGRGLSSARLLGRSDRCR